MTSLVLSTPIVRKPFSLQSPREGTSRPRRSLADDAALVTRREDLLAANESSIENLVSETVKSYDLIEELINLRKPLIRQRNLIVDRPFYLYRKSLHSKVEKIDSQISGIDKQLRLQRNYELGFDQKFMQELRTISDEIRAAIRVLAVE